MNNKGFSLPETLSVIVIISLILIIAVKSFDKTVSLSKEESYKLMKKNIILSAEKYIKECDIKTINCNFSFENNNKFPVKILKENGYFKNLNSPIDGKDLSNCLIIEAIKENGVIETQIIDTCY